MTTKEMFAAFAMHALVQENFLRSREGLEVATDQQIADMAFEQAQAMVDAEIRAQFKGAI